MVTFVVPNEEEFVYRASKSSYFALSITSARAKGLIKWLMRGLPSFGECHPLGSTSIGGDFSSPGVSGCFSSRATGDACGPEDRVLHRTCL